MTLLDSILNPLLQKEEVAKEIKNITNEATDMLGSLDNDSLNIFKFSYENEDVRRVLKKNINPYDYLDF